MEEEIISQRPFFSQKNQNISDIVNIRYRRTDGSTALLPDWAKFYLNLGSFASLTPQEDDERLVVGAAIPTRSFASVFAAVGAVIQGVGISEGQGDAEEHFRYLCSLPPNTRVKHRDQDKKGQIRIYDAKIVGVTEIRGQRWLKIQREKPSMADPAAGGLTLFLPADRTREITLASNDGAKYGNLPTRQKGIKLTASDEFTSDVIGRDSISKFESESSMACVIVGEKTVLEGELDEQRFLSKNGSEGKLSGLLRIKKTNPAGNAFRSDIFPIRSRRPPKYLGNKTPTLVIFDGARGFLKWRDNFPSSNWLVILDSTSTNFEDGRDELNNRYLQRSGSEPALDGIPVLPNGIEMVIFQEMKAT